MNTEINRSPDLAASTLLASSLAWSRLIHRSSHLLWSFVFFVLMAAGGFAQTPTIRVGSINVSRDTASDEGYTLNGVYMNNSTRQKLLNTANFGSSGTVNAVIQITDDFATSGSMTAAALANYDVVFIGLISANGLTATERDALYTWSKQPGKVVIVAEQAVHQLTANRWGYTESSPTTNPTTRNATNDAVFKFFQGGPFGNVAAGISQAGGSQGYFTSTCDTLVIGQDAGGRGTIVFDTPTRDIIVADTDFFTTNNSQITNVNTISTDSDKLWGNLWAWVVGEVTNPPPAAAEAYPGGVSNTLTAWYNGSKGVCVTNSATSLGWTDLSGNGRTFNQTTAGSQPATVADGLNYNRVLRFDGSNDQFTRTGSDVVPIGTNNYTIFAVAKPTATSGGRAILGANVANSFDWSVEPDNQVTRVRNSTVYVTGTAVLNSGPARLLRTVRSGTGFTQFQNALADGTSSNPLFNTTAFATPATQAIGSISAANYFGGDLAEIAVYNSTLSAGDVEKIESYLAVKYGLTLGGNGSSTMAYLASDGSTVWAANSGYHHDVAGIGRDDATCLDQRQSVSSNGTDIVSLANVAFADSNPANANAFASDKTFLVWGRDGAATTWTGGDAAYYAGGLFYKRMARTWKMEETGTVEDVKVRVPASTMGTAPKLIWSTDATFGAGDTLIAMTLVGSNYEVTVPAAQTADGFFTFVSKVDIDGDGLAEADDLDDDGDGIPDITEAAGQTMAVCPIPAVNTGLGNFLFWDIDNGATSPNSLARSYLPSWMNTTFSSVQETMSFNTITAPYPSGVTGSPTTIAAAVAANAYMQLSFKTQPGHFLALDWVGLYSYPAGAQIRVDISSDPTFATYNTVFQGPVAGTGWAPSYASANVMAPNTTYYVRQYWAGMNGASDPAPAVAFRCLSGADAALLTTDTDGDGLLDSQDLDSDGDGIPDSIEAQATGSFTLSATNITVPIDTDKDGTPDYLDLDSNNFGGNDTADAGLTLGTFNDADGDGLDDDIDSNDAAFGPVSAGITNLISTYPHTNSPDEVDWRFKPVPGSVGTTTYACNLVTNGDFATGNLNGWTNGGNWYINGTYAYIIADNVTDKTLTQTVNRLGTAVNGGNLTLSFRVFRSNVGGTSTLVVKLGGTTLATFVNPGTGNVTAGSGITIAPTTMPANNAFTDYVVTIPFTSIGSADTADLQFSFTGGLSDYGIDNVTINGTCPLGLAAWYKADAITGGTDGATLQTWEDSSVSNFDVTQATAGSRPVYYNTTANRLVNFNPSLFFSDAQELKNLNRLFPATSGFSLFGVGVRTTSNGATLDSIMGMGSDGNYPGMDFQLDANSAINGWNPWMTNSSPSEWGGTAAGSYSIAPVTALKQPILATLVSGNFSPAASDNIVSWLNGYREQTTLDAKQQSQIGNGVFVGSSSDAQFIGMIPEVVIYNGPLSDAQVKQVQTYLALKYGITLHHDFVSPTGSVLYAANGGTATDFDSRITGIGREDCAELYQKQSLSQHGGLITIGANNSIAATNAANTATLANGSYLVFGDDSGSLEGVIGGLPGTPPADANSRIPRVWKAVETGSVGSTRLSFPTSGVAGAINITGKFWLVTADDAAFTQNVRYTEMTSSGSPRTVDVDLVSATSDANSDKVVYFSIAGEDVPGPGCVTQNLRFWLKGDFGLDVSTEGAAVGQWADAPNMVNPLSQATAGSKPTLRLNGMNWNPALDFDNGDWLQRATNTVWSGANDPTTIFTVSAVDTTGDAYNTLISFGGPGDLPALHWHTAKPNFYMDGVVTDFGLNVPAYSAGFPLSTPTIFNAWAKQNADTDNIAISVNGIANRAVHDPNTNTFASSAASLVVGAESTTGSETLDGMISEVIVYNRKLSDDEIKKVNSYLAIKYGVTLSESYLEPTGGVIFPADGTGATQVYDNRITGLGREDCTTLNQKQSRSVAPGNQLSIALVNFATNNPENTNNHANDASYFIIGDNNAPTAAVALPGGVDSDIAAAGLTVMTQRKWKAIETGDVGSIRIRVPKSSFSGLYWESMKLLVTEQGGADSFATLAVNPIAPAAVTASEVEFVYNFPADSDPSQPVYFAFAGEAPPSPGCVAGVRLWAKANEGTFSNVSATTPAVTGGQVHSWQDQSGNGFHLTKLNTNGSLLGDAANNRFNFNPFLNYDNQLGYKTVLSGVAAATDDGDVFIVANWSGSNHDFAGFNTSASQGGSTQSDYSNYFVISDKMFYWNFNASPNATTGGSTLEQGTTTLLGYRWLTNAISMDANGSQRHTGTVSNDSPGTGTFQVGEGPGGDNTGNFDIAEVLYFNRSLSAAERQKVNSYLAVKYGVTLEHDYLSPAGATVYSANGGSSSDFDANVFGIAREACSGLHQKQSKSINTSARLTIGIDNEISAENATHTGGIAVDSSYLIIGDNAATGLTNLSPGSACVPPGNDRVTNLVYKVQETGTIETTKLTVDLSGFGFNGNYPVYMQVSADSAFTMWDNFVMTKVAGSTYTTNFDFSGTKYLRFSGNATAPAGLCTTDKVFNWFHRGGAPIPPWNVTITGWNVNSLAQTYTESVAPNHTITATVTDANNSILNPNWYPTTNYGNFLFIPRYENAAGESNLVKTTITMNKPAASVSFSLLDIDGWVRGRDIVKVYGRLSGAGPIAPKIALPWANAVNSRTITAADTVTAGLGAWDITPAGTAHVAFDEPIDEIVIEYTKDNQYPFKVYNDMRIGPITVKCQPPAPVVTTPDNVYVFKEADSNEAKAEETFTFKFTLQNLGCENKTINFADTLPTNMQWIAESLTYDLSSGAVNAYADTRNLTIAAIVVPPGTHYLYASAKATAAGAFTNQATFTVTASGNTYSSDWPGAGGAVDATPITILAADAQANITIQKAADVTQVQTSGEVEYTFTLQNNGSSAVKVNFQDNLQEEATYVAGSLTGVTAGTPPTGPAVEAYGGESTLAIFNLEIPANGVVTLTVRADMNGTPALTEVKNFATMTPEAGQGFRVQEFKSNETTVTVVNDVDGDGVSASVDEDDDNDGVPDSVELANARPGSNGDSDGDGLTDDVDPDSDNDGISDAIENGGTDADGDGRVDGTADPATGQIGTALTPADTDGDGRMDSVDLDSDNDGITDVRETNGVDANKDGMADSGLTAGSLPDTDLDGVPDVRDLDSDNDGLSDLKESGYTLTDANGDSLVDGPDADNDGLRDSADANDALFGEGANGDTALADSDSAAAAPQNDGIPNYRDTDSDGDGANDLNEAGLSAFDANGDGRVDGSGDTDGDGILNVIDSKPATDGWLLDPAADADGDGVPNSLEGMGVTDTDGDGVADASDLDSDNDGILDAQEACRTYNAQTTNGAWVGMTSSNVTFDYDAAAIQTNPLTVYDENGVLFQANSGGAEPRVAVSGNISFGATFSTPVPANEIGFLILDLDGASNGSASAAYTITVTGGATRANFSRVTTFSSGLPYDPATGIVSSTGAVNDQSAIIRGSGSALVSSITITSTGVGAADFIAYTFFGLHRCASDRDSDGDGIVDRLDLDSDNDGINDVREAAGTDADNNGVADGTPDTRGRPVPAGLNAPDTDSDGQKDYLDLDSDNDGVSDLIENGASNVDDLNGDGVVDGPDADNDGIMDSVDGDDAARGDTGDPLPRNTDSTDLPDYRDPDSDNDGTMDIVEIAGLPDANNDGKVDGAFVDADNDGIADSIDSVPGTFGGIIDPLGDADGDGINNGAEGLGAVDTDGDGVPDYRDADTDNDGISDLDERTNAINGGDTDGDGKPDYRDLDSDNDGINDVREADGTDANGDGKLDGTVGSNGMVGTGLSTPDTDSDGRKDYTDLDSDNDSISDLAESGHPGIADANFDGVVDGPDADGDGIRDSADGNDALFGDATDPAPRNSDSDPDADFRDLDSDGDGSNDIVEAGNGTLDTNGDGKVDAATPDADNDGIPDVVDSNDSAFGGLSDPLGDNDGDGIPNGTEGNGLRDTDGDGKPDSSDLDTDNDGILDSVEGTTDPDGDGVPNFRDLDSDNDGINDVREAGGTDANNDGRADGTPDSSGRPVPAGLTPPNSDTDSKPDYLDLDSDNDGVSDLSESGNLGLIDANGDGVVDGPASTEDTDGDGIMSSADGTPTTWGDASDPAPRNTVAGGRGDYADLDGATVVADPTVDADGDGIADSVDTNDAVFGGLGDPNADDDNDGLTNGQEGGPTTDTDGDGVPNFQDLDSDNDGIRDSVELVNARPGSNGDTDGDGLKDWLDLDSDNDGINDVREANGTDADHDGLVDGNSSGLDTDGDGLRNSADPSNGGVSLNPPDTDSDGRKDYVDLDSDNDTIGDLAENAAPGVLDANNDGIVDGTDSDNDGIRDSADANDDDADTNDWGDTSDPLPTNTDGDTGPVVPDYRDSDSDNDGTRDIVEVGNGDLDTNNDGKADGTDADNDGVKDPADANTGVFGGATNPLVDTDGDGYPDYREGPAGRDTDGDGVEDRFDLDSDNDGIPDATERANSINSGDTDGDGVLDFRDLDSDNDGISDVREAGGMDPEGNGLVGNGAITDTNGDGLHDPLATTPLPVFDTDLDGRKDYLDIDSDNDSLSDLQECGCGYADADHNGLIDGTDADGDGIVGEADAKSTWGDQTDFIPDNSDAPADSLPDYRDLDSDNDGTKDITEAGNGALDANNDGRVDSNTDTDSDGAADVVDALDTTFGGLYDPAGDADGDGVPNGKEGPGNTDTDGDGVPDYQDVDSDNDGITDAIENAATSGNTDSDGDGVLNFRDLDSDNDGINDVIEAGGTDATGDGRMDGTVGTNGVVGSGLTPPDTDGDGAKNFVDLDSDNDSVSDLVESGTVGLADADSNGVVDGPDADGDGIQDSADGLPGAAGDNNSPAPTNIDGTDTPDYIDPDSNNDGTKDIVDAGNGSLDANNDGKVDTVVDADKDGIADSVDANPTVFGGLSNPNTDTDGDGLTDAQEGPIGTDTDSDGVADTADLDSDNDGILDSVERTNARPGCNLDTDCDGVPDFRDLDSDNDGINDVREAGGTDVNGDGKADGSSNSSGVPSSAGAGLTPPDSDGDGRENYVDLDSDGDTVPDLYENGVGAASDTNRDGMLSTADTGVTDADKDGIMSPVDARPTWSDTTDPVPTDAPAPDTDTIPNYLDLDSDGDGTDDIDEAGNGALDANNDGKADGTTDADGDGIIEPVDTNSTAPGGAGDPAGDYDGDGMTNAQEGNGYTDTDGDGVPNQNDLDSDNDGIPDATELANATNNGDSDGDGVKDWLDLDSDNDGINDVREAGGTDANGDGKQDGTVGTNGMVGTGLTPPDMDGDGRKDYLDLDSDNDSISDLVESGTPGLVDANNNGVVDGPDTDGDGIMPSADGLIGFGDRSDPIVPTDYTDIDSDNDGTPDITEAGNSAVDTNNDGRIDNPADADGDGIADVADTNDTLFGGLGSPTADSDGDGVPNNQEGLGDTDGDGIPNSQDLDSDNDGIPDATEGAGDTDGDGVPNRVDLDSDNDGINDVREAGHAGADANSDGKVDGPYGSNGLADSVETTAGSSTINYTLRDTDGDAQPNYLDLDSDNDSVSDLVESGTPGIVDANNNGVADGPDADNDGIVDSADGNDSAFGDQGDTAPVNTDGTGGPDYLDLDSDGDGTDDIDEAGNSALDGDNDGDIDGAADADHDGVLDPADTNDAVFGGLSNPAGDNDGDGIPNSQEGNGLVDTDGDGIPDSSDADSDNDGISDATEKAQAPTNGDTDGDGIPNWRDLDSDNDGINDVLEAGGTDANGDGKQDGTPGANGMVGTGLTPPDTDGDSKPNYLDLDSDNDSVSDLVESGNPATDANNDGVVDGPDADGDGIPNSVDGSPTFGDSGDTAPINTDGADNRDYLDPDSDNDGTPDIDEAGNGALDANDDGKVDGTTDADGDGINDAADTNDGVFGGLSDPAGDNDGDGVPNNEEGNGVTDTDGDGVADNADADSDGDGISDATETNADADADGVPNLRDLDSDNDGINDVREAAANGIGNDANNDGIMDGTIGTNGMVGAGLTPANFDNDGKPNYLDLDSDNDTISDLVEYGNAAVKAADTNNDGLLDGTDTDGDGIRAVADGKAGFGDQTDPAPVDQAAPDADTMPDYLDIDSDGDAINDITEAGNGSLDTNGDGMVDNTTDADGDGIPNIIDSNDSGNGGLSDPASDSDGDGIPNSQEGNGLTDTDGDGVPDSSDADSDNDGISDATEKTNAINGGDTDGDGVKDWLDLDSDNDGINDVREAGGTDANGDGKQDGTAGTNGMVGTGLTPPDTDSDGRPNYLDLDSDNDSAGDLVEAGLATLDPNNDGMVDGTDPDADGIRGGADALPTTRGDASDPSYPTNVTDLDSDDDGTPDIVENGNGALDTNNDGKVDDTTDPDGDGVPNVLDNNDTVFGGIANPAGDNDSDGIPNNQEGNGNIDTDGDGISDMNDPDSDNDGILDGTERAQSTFAAKNDTDGDGLPNWRDLDSDNDGINDVREATATGVNRDTNNDGIVDGTDSDHDGLMSSIDPSNGGSTILPVDTDGDGAFDYIDLDADNDLVSDVVEGGAFGLDANDNGVLDGPDSDGDGIMNSVDGKSGYGDMNDPAPQNSDGTDQPDYRDLDSDNDGTKDITEAGLGSFDTDGDGKVDNLADEDHDGIPNEPDIADTAFGGLGNSLGDNDLDGIANGEEGNGLIDTDGDGVTDNNDRDSDGDGIMDIDEYAHAPLDDHDTDNDGIPNHRDLDSDNDGINDVREANGTDANNDGKQDGADTDADGLADPVDASFFNSPLNPPDTDSDGRRDYLDLDTDNDSVSDLVESGHPGLTDANNDGVVDGPDTDHDGINDSADGNDTAYGDDADPLPVDQPAPDTDSTPDYRDLDSDGDGMKDVAENGNALLDTNNDGKLDNPNDTDGDGISNTVDTSGTFGGLPKQPDTDGDGIVDSVDPDDDNDGTPDVTDAFPLNPAEQTDTDGDGTGNNADTDDDNDGTPDVTDAFPLNPAEQVDTDGDGTGDNADTDDDGDGIPDATEGTADTDGDGIPDNRDLDSDNDGILDATERGGASTPNDTDGDMVPDFKDLDSDNDGINDVREVGATNIDANNDGMADGPYGTNGIADSIDSAETYTATVPTPVDTDGDSVPDYRDLDSDNDSLGDLQESGITGLVDANTDGVVDGPDSDADGIMDSADGNDTARGDQADPLPVDQPAPDMDSTPDYRDLDSDGDGTTDISEAGRGTLDTNNDGKIDNPATDTDGDGIPDVVDSMDTTFGGATPPAGFASWQIENPLGGSNGANDDPDGDGLPNLLEYATCSSAGSGVQGGGFCVVSTTTGSNAQTCTSSPAPTDIIFVLQGLTNLANSPAGWTDLAVLPPSSTPNLDGSQTLTWPNLQNNAFFSGSDKGFVRLKVMLDANGDTLPEATAYSKVWGWCRRTFAPNNVETYGIVFLNKDVFRGPVTSVTGSTVDVSASAGVNAVNAAIPAGKQLYLEVTSGAHEGKRFEVMEANCTATTIAIDPAASVPAITGAHIALRVHRTLGDVYLPANFQGTSGANTASQVQFFDSVTGQYIVYYNLQFGTNDRWALAGDSSLTDRGNTVIAPGVGMLVRTRALSAFVYQAGMVRDNKFMLSLNGGVNNLISNGYPLDLGPGQRGFLTANSFIFSTNQNNADRILQLESDYTPGATSFRTFHYFGTASNNRWVRSNDPTLLNRNNEGIMEGCRAVFFNARTARQAHIEPRPWTP
jgi:hypothetical protein